MPHVTFIHGVANKPPPAELLRLWQEALANAGEPVPLGDLGVTSSMVYWADLLYDAPDPDTSSYEGVLEDTPAAVDAGGGALAPQPRSEAEARFLEGLKAKMTLLAEAQMQPGQPAVPAQPQAMLERIPLPWFIKRRFLDVFLRDAHHYLFDAEFGAAGRPPVHIQQAVRARFVEALAAPGVRPPHVVVAHSLGTVIAYDCLERVANCPSVDGLITFGSPLGLDEVQDRLQPGWTRRDGFPDKVGQGWVNVYDGLDPVCGFDPVLANDFQRHGDGAVRDVPVQNEGIWRHSAAKYLRQAAFGTALRRMLSV